MDTSLIEKILTVSATEDQKAEFEVWMSESEKNRIYFEQVKLIWEKSGRIPQIVSFDETTAKNKIRERIYLGKIERHKTKTRRMWISIAASVVILLGIGMFSLRMSGIIWQKSVEYISLNEIKEIGLPDGTHVWLNKNSKLTAPVCFRQNQRKVVLTGEAYFVVSRDELKPFKICTGKTITKVLGTSFNIKMDTVSGNVSVVVRSGKVAFYPLRKEKDGVLLIAGDMADFSSPNHSIQKGSNNDLNFLAWKTGILTFRNTPLKEVCRVLEQYYNQPVSTTLSDPDFIITGKFENEKIEDILSTVQLTLDVKIAYNNEEIVIYK